MPGELTGWSARLDFHAQDLFDVAADSVASRKTEADLRSDLLLPLVSFVTEFLQLSPRDVRQEGGGGAGRFDSMFGRAIIEYKRPRRLDSPAERRSAAEQALRYLNDPKLEAAIVVVTDGSTWGILRNQEAEPEPGEQAWLDFGPATPRLTPEQQFVWLPLSEATTKRVLTLLSAVKATPVTAGAINDRMGPSRPEVEKLLGALAGALRSRAKGSRTEALFHEWVKQAGVAYGIDSASAKWPGKVTGQLGPQLTPILGKLGYAEAIFVLHTYVGLASKLLACEVLAVTGARPQLRPTEWASLPDQAVGERLIELEEGRLTEDLGAPGLLGGDLFGWYIGELSPGSQILEALRGVLHALSELAWAQIATAGGTAVDLLRAFYQAVVPRAMRRYLGEFFTPRYLAERVFGRALELSGSSIKSVRVLDPACGSGTFLVAVLRAKLRDLDAHDEGDVPEAIAAAIDSVIGLDINPISAVMSQVNLILTLGDRADRLPSVRFHVYHADSILHPTVSSKPGFLTVRTEVQDFHLPLELASLTRLRDLATHIARGVRNRRSPSSFRARMAADLSNEIVGDASNRALEGATELYSAIRDLHDEDRNGVWSRFIQHALAPQLLEPVDLVVGNPPWISWKDLPPSWKERSAPLWKSFGLWHQAKPGSGIPLSDVSVLMTARSLDSYCRDGGLVAMLLPESVLIADPGGRPFRRCYLGSDEGVDRSSGQKIDFAPLHVDDFSSVNPFSPDASNKPVALYLRKGMVPAFPIDVDIWMRSTRGVRLDLGSSWSGASFRLTRRQEKIAPVDDHDVESPWGRSRGTTDVLLLTKGEEVAYEWGRGFETRGLDGIFFCEILTPEPLGAHKTVRIRSRPDLGKNTKDDPPRTAEIEARFLWPLVKGRDVSRWVVAKTSLYCIVPYENGRVLTVDEIRVESPLLFDYLESFLPRLLDRSLYRKTPDPARPWILSGPFEHLDPLASVVMTRYIAGGGEPMAAVEVPRVDRKLGRKTVVFPNNKCNIIFTHNLAEAHYLAGWTNSAVATTGLGRFAASTGITPVAMQRLPIPKFDVADRLHRTLAQMAQRCRDELLKDKPIDPIVREIDAVVELIAWRYLARLRPQFRRRRRVSS
jgi:hypothetical protein